MGFPSTVPMDHPLVLRATLTAVHSHDGQRRKHVDEPYVAHPIRVAHRVAERTMDPHVIAAALLHDVVEDTDTTLDELGDVFGYRIHDMVEALTNVPRQPGINRAQRRKIDHARIAAAGRDVQLIKAADIMDNWPSIRTFDPGFAKVYLAENNLLLTMMNELDPHIQLELEQTLLHG